MRNYYLAGFAGYKPKTVALPDSHLTMLMRVTPAITFSIPACFPIESAAESLKCPEGNPPSKAASDALNIKMSIVEDYWFLQSQIGIRYP